MSSHQFGFLWNESLLALLDVNNAADSGMLVNIIYLDFQKAFDRVPHDELLPHGLENTYPEDNASSARMVPHLVYY